MLQAKMSSCHLECTKQDLTMTKIVTTVSLASGNGLFGYFTKADSRARCRRLG